MMVDLSKINYQRYLAKQKHWSSRSMSQTDKHVGKRLWVYSRMQELEVYGKTMLCVGARHDSEVNFFQERGFAVDGIDLHATGKIIECDMSKMLEHDYLKDKNYDVVFSHDSMEHCLDLEGFIKGLNVLCKGYFVCTCPFHGSSRQEEYNVKLWDCSIHKFMIDPIRENLLETFREFSVVVADAYPTKTKCFFVLKKL